MSALPPLSPLPSITPQTASTSSPLPAAPGWGAAPFSQQSEPVPAGKMFLPAWPTPGFVVPPASQEALGTLPATSGETITENRGIRYFVPFPQETPETIPTAPETSPIAAESEPDFTDEDLREAMAPLFRDLIKTTPDHRLEPMLRATIRRALAEYSPTNRPLRNASSRDRFFWRMQALFTSRTYEEILFEKTHRFQVEEVFLVDASSLALVSYASANPGRHSSTKRIETTVKRLAHRARNAEGRLVPMFRLPDGRNVFCHQGHYITLLTIVRGMPNEMALTDLGYALETIENRFRERFDIPGSPLLKLLQPFLEDCLLIQSPANAA